MNPFQSSLAGTRDAYILKLDPSGGLLYGTYFGGSSDGDFFQSMTLDSAGNIILAGNSRSEDYPLVNADQSEYRAAPGVLEAVVTKLSASGDALLFSAFFATPSDGNWNPDADLNGDDAINATDLQIMRRFFFGAPGPSGVPNSCDGA